MVWSRLTEGMQSEMHIPILNFGDQDQEIWVDLFGVPNLGWRWLVHETEPGMSISSDKWQFGIKQVQL